MTENNQDEDLLLKLSMAGKSLRTQPQDAPKLPEQQQNSQPVQDSSSQLSPTSSIQQTLSQPASEQPSSPAPVPASISPSSPPKSSEVYQPQRETNTIVPPANTPPTTEAAQEDILRRLTMKPKNYEAPQPASSTPQQDIRPPPGYIYQTPEEVKSNKPYVSTESEVERVRNLARNIYGSDVVQKRTQKK